MPGGVILTPGMEMLKKYFVNYRQWQCFCAL